MRHTGPVRWVPLQPSEAALRGGFDPQSESMPLTRARQVTGPTIPSIVSRSACWKLSTAASVPGPKVPSTVTACPRSRSTYCRVGTGCPRLPGLSTGHGWIWSLIAVLLPKVRLPGQPTPAQTACRPRVDRVEAPPSASSGQTEEEAGQFLRAVARDHVIGGDLVVAPGRRGLGP